MLEVTYGEYAARCRCCTTFRTTPEGVPPKARYDDRVRDLVLDRVLKDGMSIERVLASLRREFLLDLSTGFVYDVLRDQSHFPLIVEVLDEPSDPTPASPTARLSPLSSGSRSN